MAKNIRTFLLVLLAGCAHRAALPVPTEARLPYTVLTAEDIQNSPGQSLEQLLMAHVPGLFIERGANGQAKLVIRSRNTILGDDEALFVLNGIALGPAVTSNLTAVDIHEIETVQVLREAAATAAYGVRGANGVIVIRTKQN